MFVVSVAANPVETYLIANHPCTEYSMMFSHKHYNFGEDHNTTFYVYLFNFRAPFLLQVRRPLCLYGYMYLCT